MKKLLLILMVVLMSLSPVFAVEAPPIVNLVAQDTGSDVYVIVTAYDRYDNAGIKEINVYENSILIGRKTDCGSENPCLFELNRAYPAMGGVSYTAEAVDLNNHIVQSNVVNLNLAPVITGPTAVNINPSEVRIDWVTDELSDSRVRYGLISENYIYEKYDFTQIESHSVSLTGLSEGLTYYYVVESTDGEGKTAISAEGTFTPRNPLAPVISNVNINVPTSTPINVLVTWNTDELSDSRVRYGTASGVYGSVQYDAAPVLSHSITLPSLADDATYYVIIESTDTDIPGNIAKTIEMTFDTPDFTGPVISNIQIESVILGEMKISWNTNELSTGSVRYGTTTGVYDVTVDEGIVLATSHEVTLAGLLDGQTYYFVINSMDNEGNPAISTEQSFGVGNLIITFREPDDGDDFELGETIEGELRVRNLGINEIDVDITITLYDDSENDEIVEIELDGDIKSGDYEDFTFEINLPYSLDTSNDYKIIAKVETDEGTYEREVEIDLDRKSNDVIVKNLGIYSTSDTIEVNVEVENRGKKDQEEVYVELKIYGLGLNLISESFNLEDWEGDNREVKTFSFDRPSEGKYTLEATVFFGAESHYKTQELEIKEISSKQSNTELIQGNIQGIKSDQVSYYTSEPEFEVFTLKNVTWGIVDFLLLSVVIYLVVWLIRRL